MKDNDIFVSVKKYLKSFLPEGKNFTFTPIFLLIICVLLTVISVQLNFANRYIKRIATNGVVYKYETETSEESNNPFEIFSEDSTTESVAEYSPESTTKADSVADTVTSDTNPTQTTKPAQTTQPQGTVRTYVINKSSKKIHYPNCTYASSMKEENKLVVNVTSEQLQTEYLSNGYTFCSKCGA